MQGEQTGSSLPEDAEPRIDEASLPSGPEETAQAPEDVIPQPPFWRRCPVTFGFTVLLVLMYLLTTYPSGFQSLATSPHLLDKQPNALMALVLANLGVFIPEAFHNGEWWRLYTAGLLHANLTHLLSNVFGLVVFGGMLEHALGSARMLLLYLIAQTVGMLLSYYVMPVVSLGASAIDYGLLGTYIGLMLILRYRQSREAFQQELRGALGFVVIFVISNAMEMSVVNLWAHLGGFLSGLIFAAALVRKPATR